MAKNSIPPYYEVVRLTHESDQATLSACVKYRSTPAPEMSLSWLRNSAYKILSGQLTRAALEHAIDEKLPPNARASVKAAVGSLIDFSTKKSWIGERLPSFKLEVGRGFVIPVYAAGRFHADADCWVVGLQPRLDGGPDLSWQMQTWLALLNEAYCMDPLAKATPLVLDVSRSKNGMRGFHLIDPATITLISRDELNARMDRFINCYLRAMEIVPIRPTRSRRESEVEEHPRLPGI